MDTREAANAVSLEVDSPKNSAKYSRRLKDVLRWDFDVFQAGEAEWLKLIAASMHFFDFSFLVPTPCLQSYMKGLKEQYLDRPYHNWEHALHTHHLTFLIVADIFAAAVPGTTNPCLEEVDVLALMLAAVGHDAGHRGYNNAFEVASGTELALRYNDISVLENHHASLTCAQLKSSGIYSSVGATDAKRIREVVIKSILDTDMSKHNKHLEWLMKNAGSFYLSQVDDSDPSLSPGKRAPISAQPDEFSKEVCGEILHAADIGHPTLPWPLHHRMCILCTEEFYAQYKEETERGLPSLPSCILTARAVALF
jgi:hypothetical protein